MLPFVSSASSSYWQTPRRAGKGEAKIIRTTQMQHRYAHVEMLVQPLERGTGFEFSDEAATTGAIPQSFLLSVEAGGLRAAQIGLWGFPLTDFRATILNGSYHDVDSNNEVFEEVAELAFFEAMLQSEPFLLEPWIRLAVSVGEEYLPAVFDGLSRHRSLITDTQKASANRITMRIPQSEAVHFLGTFASLTAGTGTFSASSPDCLDELPMSLTWRFFCPFCSRDMIVPLIQGKPFADKCLICGTPFEPPDFALPVRKR
jgi:elongation factor G